MMESSFAQQQFEEMRRQATIITFPLTLLLLPSSLVQSSSRIGRQEDADDIRKEAERLARKKRKRVGGQITPPTGAKQTKLSFK